LAASLQEKLVNPLIAMKDATLAALKGGPEGKQAFKPEFTEDQTKAFTEYQDELKALADESHAERLQAEADFNEQMGDISASRRLRDRRDAEDMARQDAPASGNLTASWWGSTNAPTRTSPRHSSTGKRIAP
jgi:hypothetical protein